MESEMPTKTLFFLKIVPADITPTIQNIDLNGVYYAGFCLNGVPQIAKCTEHACPYLTSEYAVDAAKRVPTPKGKKMAIVSKVMYISNQPR